EVVEGTGTLTVAFAREAALDTKAVDPRHALLVQPSEAIPAEGKTRATILLPAGASYRYFRVGHRVVVDLIRPAGRTAAAAPRKAHGAPSPRAPKVSKAAADHEIPPRPRRKPTLAAAAVPAAPAAPAPEPPPAGAEAEPATTPTGPEAPPAPPGRPTGS